jgi:hypothetical protein
MKKNQITYLWISTPKRMATVPVWQGRISAHKRAIHNFCAGRSGQAWMPGLGRGGRAETPVDYRHGRENRCFYGITSKSNKGKKNARLNFNKEEFSKLVSKNSILSRSSLHPKGHERCSWPLA